jgi:hypothetical protein
MGAGNFPGAYLLLANSKDTLYFPAFAICSSNRRDRCLNPAAAVFVCRRSGARRKAGIDQNDEKHAQFDKILKVLQRF